MAFTNLAVFGGAFFTPILVGKITHTIKWWWTFNLVSIFCAASLIAVFLFCPETAYRRDASLNTDIVGFAHSGDSQANNSQEKMTTGQGMPSNLAPVVQPKKTFTQSLALFDGRKTDESFFKLLFRPLPLFAQPAFLWAALIQGTSE